jgi:uncharacterized protein involved in type VI secretion and phage assembly
MSVLLAERTETQHEAGGVIRGLALGNVVRNDDPDGLGRVQLQFPWHENPKNSHWARLSTVMAGPDRGWLSVPEVGDQVVVAFLREDVRFPIVLGAIWNDDHKPPADNADGKNDKRMFRSRKEHELIFDDGQHGRVELKHQKGRHVVLDDDVVTMEDENGNFVKIECAAGNITINAIGKLSIKAASVSIEAQGTMDLTSRAIMKMNGSLVKIN